MTSWRDVPPVEPLSDLSWKRIERGVFDQLEDRASEGDRGDHVDGASAARRSRWWPGLAVAGAACAAAAAVLLIVRGPDRADGERGDVAAQPSRIVTAESPVEITVGRASLTIAPRSALWVSGDDHSGVQVILERGEVGCAVAYRAHQPPFTVQAGEVRVEVVGTQFSVSRHEEAVAVSVTRGVVEVIARGAVTRVGAGQTWPADTDGGTGPGPTGRDTPAGEAMDQTAGPDGARGASAATRGETTTRSAGGHQRGHASRAAGPAAARGGVSDRAHPERGASTPSARERFEEAARLEAGDPAAAIVIYRELVEEGGPWAANALFGQARLELERGRRRAARRLLRAYLRKYPHGANAADARALLSR